MHVMMATRLKEMDVLQIVKLEMDGNVKKGLTVREILVLLVIFSKWKTSKARTSFNSASSALLR